MHARGKFGRAEHRALALSVASLEVAQVARRAAKVGGCVLIEVFIEEQAEDRLHLSFSISPSVEGHFHGLDHGTPRAQALQRMLEIGFDVARDRCGAEGAGAYAILRPLRMSGYSSGSGGHPRVACRVRSGDDVLHQHQIREAARQRALHCEREQLLAGCRRQPAECA